MLEVRSNTLVQHYSAHGGAVNSVDFHPSGNFLTSTSADGTIKVYDLREGHLYYTLHGHEGATTCAAFSPAGDFFASGGADEQVMVWRTNFDREFDKCKYVLLVEQSNSNSTPPNSIEGRFTRLQATISSQLSAMQ